MDGLCGAQGTGKTTLAKAIAEKHGALYVDASVTKIIRGLGFDPSCTSYDFATRLTLQEGVLREVDAIYACVPAGTPAVCDRTPIDFLAYTISEAIGDKVLPEDQERLKRYIQDCFDVTNKRFATITLVQPGIPLQPGRDGKGVANEAYIEHLNSLMLGLTVDPRLKSSHFYLPRSMLTIEERITGMEGVKRRCMYLANQALGDHLAAGGVLQ